MQTPELDKIFLEISQFTKAKTNSDIEFEKMRDIGRELLLECREVGEKIIDDTEFVAVVEKLEKLSAFLSEYDKEVGGGGQVVYFDTFNINHYRGIRKDL